jgi:hypothetical protein
MSHYEKGCAAKLSSDFLPDAELQLEMGNGSCGRTD